MKLTIDDTNKTIEVEGQAKIEELLHFLTKLGLHIGEWSIVGTKFVQSYYPYYPSQPWITWCGDNPVSGTVTNAKIPFTYTAGS